MLRIGKTTFDDSVKKYTWTRFRKEFENVKAIRHNLNRNGFTRLEDAFKFLTGKDVPEVHKPDKKDKN